MASSGVEEVDNNDFLMATKILTNKIRLESDNHELYFERSICYHKLGNFQASLDDANAALRLNASDYNIYYQKGLALIGLTLFKDAIKAFKKAIELRAKQDDSKLSDIFELLKNSSRELNNARGRAASSGLQQTRAVGDFGETTTAAPASSSFNTNLITFANRLGTSGEPVDSTTDRLLSKSHGNFTTVDNNNSLVGNNSNLVIKNCNNFQSSSSPSTNQMVLNIGSTINKVSSTANHNNYLISRNQITVNNPGQASLDLANIDESSHHHHNHRDHLHHPDDLNDPSKSSFEWNIRRSERIFLHNSSEHSASSPQMTYDHIKLSTSKDSQTKSHRTNSNPSSMGSGRVPQTKRVFDPANQIYQDASNINNNNNTNNSNLDKSRDNATNSHIDSDIDVDDASNRDQHHAQGPTNDNLINGQRKRVMVTPSSSMPATSNVDPSPNSSTPKDDSYSSKYKRLRRDRERARRGTSKLCTIKPSDLDELRKAGSGKKFMRVIAPIDGWLYSGQLSLDDGTSEGEGRVEEPHYVVKLDGDSSGNSYLFTQETVLNDVIKEVRVKSVSDLRKGARICCYWSRTYKCLSTGVVTSRTFEATKSLVSVKYDNGDLSALPLEDLRLLPPDYPKYMSNCDPLLLAKYGDGIPMECSIPSGTNRIVVAGKSTVATDNTPMAPIVKSSNAELTPPGDSDLVAEAATKKQKVDDTHISFQPIDQDDTDDDEALPPTNQAIDFITSGEMEADLVADDDIDDDDDDEDDDEGDNDESDDDTDEQVSAAGTKDNVSLNKESQVLTTNGSRASSEENNFGVEYRPWVFEGAPKRCKRHGRTYRDNYTAIRRGLEILRIGDSAELMPRDSSILPFVAKIDGLWCTAKGEMRVKVRWYYRLDETEGDPCDLKDAGNALFETDHFDENDVQSIWRSTKIVSWTEYSKSHLGHENKPNEGPKIFYLAGYYDPIRRTKHLRTDVKQVQKID